MNNFEIISDTSHDLPRDFEKENNIKSVSFHIRLDDDVFLRDQIDITREELYAYLKSNPKTYPKTSLPSVDDYIVAFEESLEKGKDVLCFTVSSTLSGSYQSANVAGGMMEEKYPDRKIYIIDSESASLGVGILIERAVEMRKDGLDIDTCRSELIKLSKTTEVYICLDTLSYLEKGGRISRTGAFAGDLLRIKPIASFKNNKLSLEKAVRGSKKSVRETLKLLDEKISGLVDKYEIFVIHGDVRDLALEIKERIEEKYNIKIRHDATLVSASVISHIGPGAIGIGIIGK